jgi:autotransporter translocation and assembly factor TamB
MRKPVRHVVVTIARVVLRVAGWSVIAACLLVVLAFAALELPYCRQLLRTQANKSLQQLFKGTLVIDRIGNIGIFAITGIDAHVLDPKNNRVIQVSGLSAKSIWPRMLPALIRGGPLVITIDRASCDHVEVMMIDDGNGSPTLAETFLPRAPEPTSGPTTTSVVLPAIRVRHLWAHGSLSSMPVIDVDLADVTASLSQRPERMQALLEHLRISARSTPARIDPVGTLKASVDVPAAPGSAPTISASFDGTLLAAPSTMRAQLQAGRLQAQLKITDLKSEALREYDPSLKMRGPTALEAQVDGQLPRLGFTARVENAALHAALKGATQLGPIKTADASLEVTRLNLAEITDAPASTLQLRLNTAIRQSEAGQTDGTFSIEVPQGEAGGMSTPTLHTDGSLSLTPGGLLSVSGKLSVDEPGAYAQLEYKVRSQSAEQRTAEGKLSVQFTRPPRAERLLGLTASGALLAQGQVDLARSRLSSTLLLEVQPLIAGSASIRTLRARATASGSLQNPTFNVDSSATDVALGSRRFARVLLSLEGNANSCKVEAQADEDDQRRVGITTSVALRNLTELIEPRVTLAVKNQDELSVRARRVRLGAGSIRLEQLELAGVGQLKADGTIGERQTDLTFAASELQIARLMRALGLPTEMKRASFSAEGHLSGPLRKLNGQLKGSIDDLDFREIRSGTIALDVSVNDNVAAATVDAKLGHSHVMTNLEDFDLPVLPVTRKSLFGLRGKATVKANVDLDRIAPFLRTVGLPVQRASGEVQVDLSLDSPRKGPAAPRIALALKTKNLRFVEQRNQPKNVETASAARNTQPISVEGIDFDANLEVDPMAREAHVRASATDKSGALVELTIASKLPDLAQMSSLAALVSAPLDVQVAVPERSFDALPRLLRPQGMKGYFSAQARLEGSVKDPRLDAVMAVRRLKYRPRVPGIEASAKLRYESASGELSAVAYSGDRKIALVSSQWTGNLLDKLRDVQNFSGFRLDGDLELSQFPVGVVPALADHSIRGVVSGNARLRDFGKDADLQARIDGSKLTIRNQKVAELEAVIQANGRDGLYARLRVEQKPGALQAQFQAPLQWGTRLAPAVGTGAKAALQASQFQIETLSPLLLPTVSELDGTLDADFKVQLTDGAPHLKGTAQLQQGMVEVPQIGQRFSDVAAHLSIDGSEIRLDSLQARGTTGRVTANAQATMNGTDLQSASARLDISSREKLPITFEGVEVGDAWGHVDFSYRKSAEGTDIRVDVPKFHMQLPEESMANVQGLGADEHVQVGIFAEDGKFAAIPVQPLAKSDKEETAEDLPTKVHVHLGDNVWVERAQQAKVQLSGDLTLTSGELTRIDGRIDLRGGTLDVNGKTFHVENGTVAFTGADSANPTITATARWDSPAGYAVYAQFAGTAENGKLTLRAEPQLTQNEIVSLLLFGSPEGALGASAGGGGAAATAVGVAGDTAAKGFNRMVTDFTHLDVSARIDTSTGSARPELVVQVTPRLTTRVTRALGEPTPGQSPDRTFLTMELRLKRAWALSAVVGDRGASALDLIWRHRY